MKEMTKIRAIDAAGKIVKTIVYEDTEGSIFIVFSDDTFVHVAWVGDTDCLFFHELNFRPERFEVSVLEKIGMLTPEEAGQERVKREADRMNKHLEYQRREYERLKRIFGEAPQSDP